jgi:PDZ domain-containing protein
VDLSQAIIVPGHSSPPSRFYLTDVNLLPGRPAYYVAAKALPGFEIVRRRELVPPNMSDRDLDRELVNAMSESQTNAQIVAERAAGLHVVAVSTFVILKTVPGSPGARCFRVNDKITRVDGMPLRNAGYLAAVTTSKPAGTAFTLTLLRSGQRRFVRCYTFRFRSKAHFGVTGSFQTEAYSLPVRVRYHLPNINGSSAGLMFALQIYRAIAGRDISRGQDVAGTGVLASDGTVGPIEGEREKVRAAIKARAAIFLVPKPNYDAIRNTPGIRVIPVTSFQGALAALQKSH